MLITVTRKGGKEVLTDKAAWSTEKKDARRFVSSAAALLEISRQQLEDVVILMNFEDEIGHREYNVELPIRKCPRDISA